MSRMATVIDFGTSKIAIVTGRLDERGALVVSGAAQQAYAGFRNDEWLDVDGLEQAILGARKAAERQAGRRIRDLYVAVPGEYISAGFRRADIEIRGRNGIVTRDDIEELIAATGDFEQPEGYVPLHRTPVAYIMDNQTRYRPPVGERARFMSGYVSHVLALESFVEDVGATLSDLGIGVLGMVAGPVGTGYLVRADSGSKRTVVVIDAGHFTTDIIVAEGDGLVFHENLPMGGSTITKDISLLLKIPPEEADWMKRQLVLGVQRGEDAPNARYEGLVEAQEIAENRIWEMADAIVKSLETIGIHYDGQTAVYLTGGGLGHIRGAKDVLSAALGQVVKLYANASPLLGGPGFTAAAGSLYYSLNVLQSAAAFDIIGWFKDLFR